MFANSLSQIWKNMTFLHIPMKWALRWQHSTPFWSHQNNAFAQNMAFSRHQTFLSTLYIIETHPLRTSTAASDCLGQKFQEEDPARFLAPHGSRPAVSPTHTITGRWHVIVLPHFKKNSTQMNVRTRLQGPLQPTDFNSIVRPSNF